MVASTLADLYLDLLADRLLRRSDAGLDDAGAGVRGRISKALRDRFVARQWRARLGGRKGPVDLPTALAIARLGDADTMIGDLRLRNVRDAVSAVLERGVEGDLIETGVWRGGAVIYMRAILAAHNCLDRTVWVADSFQGLPRPTLGQPLDQAIDYSEIDYFAVSRSEVERRFASYGLLDDQVKFLEGWFSETLPAAPIQKLAVVRLDGDMYESTMDAISVLYPKLSVGGYLLVDDYGSFEACRAAIDTYRRDNQISAPIVDVDGQGIYWIKESGESC